MSDITDISVGYDDGVDVGTPFVYFQLYDGDTGSLPGRDAKPEFINRNPSCADLTPYSATLLIANSGDVASDLVIVEYKVVFCTYEGHLPQQGFSSSHAGEVESSSEEEIMNVAFVPAGGSHRVTLNFPPFPVPELLKNVYLQARVSTLWTDTPIVWDFATDPRVTEVHVPV